MLQKFILIIVSLFFFNTSVTSQTIVQRASSNDTFPKWRKDLDSAILNKINFMTANFEKYIEDSKKMSADMAYKTLIRQQDIDRYSGTIVNLIKILEQENRPFNEKEQKALKGIQNKLILWSKEGLHYYLDKLAFYTLQQINVFIKTFEIEGYLKINK